MARFFPVVSSYLVHDQPLLLLSILGILLFFLLLASTSPPPTVPVHAIHTPGADIGELLAKKAFKLLQKQSLDPFVLATSPQVVEKIPDEELKHAELVDVQASGGGGREGGRKRGGGRGGGGKGRFQVHKLVIGVVLRRGTSQRAEERNEEHEEGGGQG